MADMDSPGAANRQSPTSVRRNKAPSPKVPKMPRSKVLISTGNSGTRRRISNNNNNNNSGHRNALRRRSSNSSSSSGHRNNTHTSTPSSPPQSTSKVIKPAAPPKPVIPDTGSYLKSDSTYQKQMAAYAKSLADFQADQGLAKTDYDTGYQGTYRDIGLAKQDASENLKNDFASRGMLQSSLYNEGLGDLNNQYQNQYNDLAKQRTGFLDQLTQELTKYRNEQGTQSQNAQAEALRRRQEKYNL